MPNDSTTGGYIQPSSVLPPDDQALDRTFHDLFMNLSGLPAASVLPRWQEIPPNMPANGTSWIAQGVTDRRDDVFAWQDYDPISGSYTLYRNQEIDNLVSFYGPQSSTLEALVRDNFSLRQNRDVIDALGIVLVELSKPRTVPELWNERWQKRIDVVVTFRRLLTRTYPIDTLVSAPITVTTDTVPPIVDNVNAS